MWEYFFGPYSQLLGLGTFLSIWVFVAAMLAWIKTKHFLPGWAVMLVGYFVLAQVVPGGTIYLLLYLSATLGVAYALYMLFVRKKPPWSD